MKNLILFFGIALVLSSCHLSQPVYDNFEGKLVYTIEAAGNTSNPNDSINYQIIYAKDSMLRIDNFTPIGKQTFIQKIPSDTAYLLMDLGFKKVALQTIFDTKRENDNYIFRHKSGSKIFAGIKAKNIKVYDKESDTTIIMNYYPKISPKYSTALEGMPGLPVNYSVPSKGQWINYRLNDIQRKPLSDSVFTIPTDYEIMTLDEFMELIQSH